MIPRNERGGERGSLMRPPTLVTRNGKGVPIFRISEIHIKKSDVNGRPVVDWFN